MIEPASTDSPFGLQNGYSRLPKLLLVDDQPINVQALYQIFAPDYQVFMASNGALALAICKEDPPDLVLLDVVMPDMDGFEVCRRLKADQATCNIPVICVTSYDSPERETQALAVGAVDFISKPFNPNVVRARVKTHLTLKFQSDLLRQMAYVDGLTSVFNRRYFDERLVTEWRRAERHVSSLCVLLVDVDHFKRYNDQYGHQAGDDCLKRLALALKACLHRPADTVARYGGEEFACILPETALDGAMVLANRLEQYVRGLQLPHAASDIGVVTISVGVAAKARGRQGDEPGSLLALADTQLYRAKNSGRGCVFGQAQESVLIQ